MQGIKINSVIYAEPVKAEIKIFFEVIEIILKLIRRVFRQLTLSNTVDDATAKNPVRECDMVSDRFQI